ncbi:TetR/AcrR family transcriptional regulator [Candidatus Uabimicrobium sp. HlEnr_7]|uniref:TetR/AcrR family transcriptional regulator n=1 Tax=Candidatus Uabimicrobium helgolandensis TaxID=3095367 RepID=UPI00355669F7
MKKTKKHWLDAGLDILEQWGEKKLKIDFLCQQLNMTKGSFYHHFANRKEYIYELLEYWSKKYTTEIIETIAKIDEPTEKTYQLIKKVLVIPQNTEITIRIWALQNETVRQFQQQVDDVRIRFFETYLQNTNDDILLNEKNAQLIYTYYVGCQYLLPRISQEDYIEMLNHLLTIVGLPPYFHNVDK